MKTASSDEELAFKQKERDVAMYTRKAGVLIYPKAQRKSCTCLSSQGSLVFTTLLDN